MRPNYTTTSPRGRRPRVSRKGNPERIYLASPISTYETSRYGAMVSRVRGHFPKSTILLARDLFTSNADWRARWARILRTVDTVVFFDDEEGCIGAGTEQEISDAHRVGIPVFFLTPPPFDRLIPCDASGDVEFWPVVGGGMRQTLRVCYAIPADDALAMLTTAGNGGA